MEAGPFTKKQAIEIANSITEDYRGEKFDGFDGRMHFIYTACIAPYRRNRRGELIALFSQHINKAGATIHDISSYNENCDETEYTVVAVIGVKGDFGMTIKLKAVRELSTVDGLYYLDILGS